MPVRANTPEEIGGSLDDSEILVHHLRGPYKGLTLATKKNEPLLIEALNRDEIMMPLGTDYEHVRSDARLIVRGPGDVLLDTSPTAYPVSVELHVRGPLRDPAPTRGVVILDNAVPDILVWQNLTDVANGDKMLPFVITGPGLVDIRVDLDNGDFAHHPVTFNPAP